MIARKWIGPRPPAKTWLTLKAMKNVLNPYVYAVRLAFRFETVYCLVDRDKGLALIDGKYMAVSLKTLITPAGNVPVCGPADPYAPINMDRDPLARIYNAAQHDDATRAALAGRPF